jgi:hypothetical protein
VTSLFRAISSRPDRSTSGAAANVAARRGRSAEAAAISSSVLTQRFKKRPCGAQIGGAEAFGKAIVDRLKQCGGLGAAVLIAQQPS